MTIVVPEDSKPAIDPLLYNVRMNADSDGRGVPQTRFSPGREALKAGVERREMNAECGFMWRYLNSHTATLVEVLMWREPQTREKGAIYIPGTHYLSQG